MPVRTVRVLLCQGANMASICTKTALILFCFLSNLPKTVQENQLCKEATIQITNEDGSEKVFTVRHMDPNSYNDQCSQCSKMKYGSTSGIMQGHSYQVMHVARPAVIPSVTLLIGELSSDCGAYHSYSCQVDNPRNPP